MELSGPNNLGISGRVLFVDDSEVSLEVVGEKLRRHGLEVVECNSAQAALELAIASSSFDLFILDVVMPEMGGFELTRWLRQHPITRNTPILLLTSLDSTQDKIAGLEAGADDFLTKSVSDAEMLARVRSLIALGKLREKLSRQREAMARLFFSSETSGVSPPTSDPRRHAIVVHADADVGRQWSDHLRTQDMQVDWVADAAEALTLFGQGDVFLLVSSFEHACTGEPSLVRVAAERDVPPAIVVIDDRESPDRRVAAFDAGVDDYIAVGTPTEELLARVQGALRRRHQYRRMQSTRDRAVLAAITDPLTGLHNRGYFLETLRVDIKRGERYGHPVSLLMIDIDHFKRFNDRYGHSAGDRVLREVCRRIGTSIRDTDVAARYGGEEFAVVLPETSLEAGQVVAERIRNSVQRDGYEITAGQMVSISVSIGMACFPLNAHDASDLVDAADVALYAAKRGGRNQVRAADPNDSARYLRVISGGEPIVSSGAVMSVELAQLAARMDWLVSADLDSPLAGTVMAAKLLLEHTEDSDPLHPMTQQLHDTASSLNQLLHTLANQLRRLTIDPSTPQ